MPAGQQRIARVGPEAERLAAAQVQDEPFVAGHRRRHYPVAVRLPVRGGVGRLKQGLPGASGRRRLACELYGGLGVPERNPDGFCMRPEVYCVHFKAL